MASTSETGHAKNSANFDTLIAYVTGYGTTYNPSRAALKLTALQTLSTVVRNAISAVNSSIPAYTNAVAAREQAFAPLNKLITRVLNALKSTETSAQVDDSAKTLARKIKGSRAKPQKTDDEKKALEAQGKEIKEISASQLSFDNRIDNLDKLIKLLASIPLYAPNEADLKVAALTTYYNDLKAKNTTVIAAATPLSNARNARNEVMYKPNTGLVDIATDVKTYLLSVYGTGSPQYKQVSRLKFKIVS